MQNLLKASWSSVFYYNEVLRRYFNIQILFPLIYHIIYCKHETTSEHIKIISYRKFRTDRWGTGYERYQGGSSKGKFSSMYPRGVNFPGSWIYLLENFWILKCVKRFLGCEDAEIYSILFSSRAYRAIINNSQTKLSNVIVLFCS